MEQKHLFKLYLGIMCMLGLVLTGAAFLSPDISHSSVGAYLTSVIAGKKVPPQQLTSVNPVVLIESASSTPALVLPSAELPVRLYIPAINVNAEFVYVKNTKDGAMDIPKVPDDVAWWSLGTRPGDIGSAVVSGHYGWKNGIPAVFDRLNKLNVGDKIVVEDERGATTTFVVRKLRTYGEHDNASEVFGSSDGKSHLNLVTCKGIWNRNQKSYSERLVVFADKEISVSL